jgi:primosomal protein N' (replication factor Y)
VADLPLIADIAVDVPGREHYSYGVPPDLADLAVGECVLVPFGPRRERGFVVAVERREPPPGVSLKAVLERRAEVRLPPHLMRLIAWGARYYRCSLGEFLAAAVPAPVREGVRMERQRSVQVVAGFAGTLTKRQRAVLAMLPATAMPFAEAIALAQTTAPTLAKLAEAGAVAITETRAIHEVRLGARDERVALTDEQRVAVEAIDAARLAGATKPFLLFGVTGSGKTLVYLELAERVIAAGRQVFFLLPEIALTPQLAGRVRNRIPRVAVWHSAFSDGERAELWRQVAAGEIDLVLGTRSALFAPLPAPGLIVVDEEHETSYKQESAPRYHARDLAIVYAQQLGIPVVLGSATPSLESVHNGRSGRFGVLKLTQRPKGGQLPVPTIVDMRLECQEQRRAVHVSRLLLTRLRAVRERGEQAIVLLNRRGWSPVVSCQSCGASVMCRSCDIALTWHRGAELLRCHYCGHAERMPVTCPACGSDEISTKGMGTEQLAATLSGEIPGLRVLRVDADTVSERQGHATLFGAFANGEADCLVGTQMVAKGLDFPRVTLVGIVGADRSLSVPDFRAGERTFQLIAQVSGRAGRGEKPGTVVVQAYDTGAVPLVAALHGGTRRFYDAELELRQQYGYPPFAGLIRFLWSGPDDAKVQLVANEDGARIHAVLGESVLLGPNPAGLAFLKGQHRWHALLKAPTRGHAQALLDRLGPLAGRKGVRVAVDVDPQATS